AWETNPLACENAAPPMVLVIPLSTAAMILSQTPPEFAAVKSASVRMPYINARALNELASLMMSLLLYEKPLTHVVGVGSSGTQGGAGVDVQLTFALSIASWSSLMPQAI